MTRAGNGGKQARDALAERYAPLTWPICRRHGPGGADAEDAGQNAWLTLTGQPDKIRLPAARPGWLATTTRRDCGRIRRVPPGARETGPAPAAQAIPDDNARTAGDEPPAAGRHAARPEAFAGLPPCCPAADRPAHREPTPLVCPDQRQTGPPGRQHRPQPQPPPGQAPPPPRHHRADQPRHRDPGVRYTITEQRSDHDRRTAGVH